MTTYLLDYHRLYKETHYTEGILGRHLNFIWQIIDMALEEFYGNVDKIFLPYTVLWLSEQMNIKRQGNRSSPCTCERFHPTSCFHITVFSDPPPLRNTDISKSIISDNRCMQSKVCTYSYSRFNAVDRQIFYRNKCFISGTYVIMFI